MKKVETKIISGAMYKLAKDIQSGDGVANAVCFEAATRLDEQEVKIMILKDKLIFFKPYFEFLKEQTELPEGF